MIRVMLCCSASGEFRLCEASGHAGFARREKDIVCSAVTVVLRSAVHLLSNLCDLHKESVSIITEASSRGNLSFRIVANEKEMVPLEVVIRLMCIADFIRDGVGSVSKEYPSCVQLSECTLDF